MNSCKCKKNAMQIVIGVWQIQVLWNFLELKKVYSHPQLVESADVEPVDMEGWLYLLAPSSLYFLLFSQISIITMYCFHSGPRLKKCKLWIGNTDLAHSIYNIISVRINVTLRWNRIFKCLLIVIKERLNCVQHGFHLFIQFCFVFFLNSEKVEVSLMYSILLVSGVQHNNLIYVYIAELSPDKSS